MNASERLACNRPRRRLLYIPPPPTMPKNPTSTKTTYLATSGSQPYTKRPLILLYAPSERKILVERQRDYDVSDPIISTAFTMA